MFAVDCPRHGGRALIWTSNIDAVRSTARGIEVDYHCTCGLAGTWLTGRRAVVEEVTWRTSADGSARSCVDCAEASS